jgi:membrane-bound metal-dependent hydrolase YbcI (DUF457 family)
MVVWEGRAVNWTGHAVTIIIAWLVLGWLGIIPLSPWVLIPALITSTLIDADWKWPLVKHRGFTHTPYFIIILAGLAYLVARDTGYEIMIVLGIVLGGIMHLGGDRI